MLPIVIIKYHEHEKNKNKLLELISKQESNEFLEGNDIISNCDWKTDIGSEREYWNFFYSTIYESLNDVYMNKILYHDWEIDNVWFQQYKKNDIHDWHWHKYTFYNHVYFLELPKDSKPTELQIPMTGEIMTPDVEEGDILIFPSILKHRSPPNTSNEQKTVIAFNVK